MISTTNVFNAVADGTIRPLALNAKISFTKQRSLSVDWFVLDQSELDGSDILATDPDDSIQLWDRHYMGIYCQKDRCALMRDLKKVATSRPSQFLSD